MFAKLKSDTFANIRNNVTHYSVEQCVPVELFFDIDGKDDIRDHLINTGHFIVLTDNDINKNQDDSSSDSLSTPSQEEAATMWKPSPRKANTDPLPKHSQSIMQSHNQSLPVTSPLMWRPKKLAPNSLSFSDQ